MHPMKEALKRRRMKNSDPTQFMEKDPMDEMNKSNELAPELEGSLEEEAGETPQEEMLEQPVMGGVEMALQAKGGDQGDAVSKLNMIKSLLDEDHLKGPNGIMKKAALKMKGAMDHLKGK